jgi:D-alanyl-D-alanine carboxypeptidase
VRRHAEQKISELLGSWLTANPNVPGLILLVRDSQDTVAVSAGHTRLDRAEPMHPNHAFRIASNTKTFVAAATMRLVELGDIQLDHAIREGLPEEMRSVLQQSYDLDAISVRMLLQHTSGIAGHDTANELVGDPYNDAIRRDRTHRWTPLEQIAFSVEHFEPACAPGACVDYSDTGYVVLGQYVEHATGQSLHALVRQHCRLNDVGLSATWWERLEAPATSGPRAHVNVDDDDWDDVDCSIDLFGGGGLVSTAADLATWWRALFAGDIISRESLIAMQSPLARSTASHGDAGLGMFRRSLAGRPWWWTHAGYWGSIVLHDPDDDLTLVAFRNQSNNTTAVLEPLLRAALDVNRVAPTRPLAR